MAMIAVNVVRAAATTGSRKACTPLLTASTPVNAVHPLANAFTRIHIPTACNATGTCLGSGTSGTGCPPDWTTLYSPTTITNNSVPTNSYVGAANADPASFIPLKLTTVNITSTVRHIAKVCGCNAGIAETRAPIPADIPTATFRT